MAPRAEKGATPRKGPPKGPSQAPAPSWARLVAQLIRLLVEPTLAAIRIGALPRVPGFASKEEEM